jgi:hypothetical protein
MGVGGALGVGGQITSGAGGLGNGGGLGQGGGAFGAGGVTGSGGVIGSGGLGVASGGSPAGGSTAAGGAGSGTGGAGTGGANGGGNTVTGTLGSAPLAPIVTALVSANAGNNETIIYMLTSAVTCSQISSPGWLGSIPASTQVVEIVIVPATTVTGTFPVPGSEVNYANGGQISLFETNASSGSITVTQIAPQGVIEGTVSATYPSGSISGSFHAEYCATGQGY